MPPDDSHRPIADQTSAGAGSAATTFAGDGARREALAAFLKARRAAIAPEQVGLPRGPRRRARGLLREEVAQRSGISSTWYVWLEQGRDIRPSPDVLEHLADALLLRGAERAHLMALARPGAPGDHACFSASAPAELVAWLDGLTEQPAYVLNGKWDVLAWNAAARDGVADFAAVPAPERNILRMLFLFGPWRSLFLDWTQVASSAVAQFRAETARYAGHPELSSLVADLARQSAAFASLWRAGDVAAPRLRAKRILHPTLGERTLTYAPLRPSGLGDDLGVIVYAPLR